MVCFVKGIWGIGLATSQANLNRVPLGEDSQSWVLRQDARFFHDNRELYKAGEEPQEGDVIGITYDHIQLNFYLNNKPLDFSFTGIKGAEVYPVIYVDEGSILDAAFTSFQYDPPLGFDRILVEKSLL